MSFKCKQLLKKPIKGQLVEWSLSKFEIQGNSPGSTEASLLGILGIALSKCIQNPGFDLAGVPVLLHGPNHLDGTMSSCLPIVTFYNFSKRSLSQQPDDFI